MRIALLTDVHANLIALNAVIADMDQDPSIDECWFLGDVTGYGPWPRQALFLLHDWVGTGVWLAGNHDLAIPRFLAGAQVGAAEITELVNNNGSDKIDERHAGELAAYTETPAYQRMVNAPPWDIPKKGIAVAHGHVREPAGDVGSVAGESSYIDRYERAEAALAVLMAQPGVESCRLLCVGHTHVPRLFYSSSAQPPYRWENLLIEFPGDVEKAASMTFEMKDDGVFVLCPGSVGQPRHGRPEHPDPRAAYAILDLSDERISVEFRRIPYHFQEVQAKMRAEGYPPGFPIDRLAFGI